MHEIEHEIADVVIWVKCQNSLYQPNNVTSQVEPEWVRTVSNSVELCRTGSNSVERAIESFGSTLDPVRSCSTLFEHGRTIEQGRTRLNRVERG